MVTKPIERALELRRTLISEDKSRVTVVDFTDTLQGKDTSRVIDLMPNTTTGAYPFRTKINIKDIDPAAAEVYGKDFFDITKASDREIEEHLRAQEFDFPIWFKHNPNFQMKRVMDYNSPFIFQVAGCNFHDGSAKGGCWYCFVDDASNDGLPGKNKTTLSVEETVDSMLHARQKIGQFYKTLGKDVNLSVLRASGGEPTIVLDWILNLWREIERRGCDFVGQLDSNLSTASVVERFEQEGVFEKDTLYKLAKYPVKVLTALKGISQENLESNVQSTATLAMQEHSLRKFLSAGFDIYPQMYNPNPNQLEKYLENIDSVIEKLSLRIHIGPLKVYGPTKLRLTLEAQSKGIDTQELIKKKTEEWDANYKKSCEILDNYLRKTYGVGYKQTTRSDISLKLKK